MQQHGFACVTEAVWHLLNSQIADLRPEHIRAAEVPAEPPWSGVHQHTLPELHTSLSELARVYASRPDLRGFCRSEVIRAKDHARLASRAPKVPPATRELKTEMVEWMLVWLSDPSLFPLWGELRLRQSGYQKDC